MLFPLASLPCLIVYMLFLMVCRLIPMVSMVQQSSVVSIVYDFYVFPEPIGNRTHGKCGNQRVFTTNNRPKARACKR